MARGTDDSLQDLIERLEQPVIGNTLLFFPIQLEKAREFVPIEAQNRLVADHGDRQFLKPQGLQFLQRLGIVFGVSALVSNAIIRKKLFRAGAGESAGSVVDLDGFHVCQPAFAFL